MKPVPTLCAAALCCLTLPAFAADPLPRATPEEVGLSSKRLEVIGATLKEDIENGRIPGAVVAVARHGRLAYYEAFGFQDKAAGVPMTKESIFSIASMTKPMVGVAGLMLYEDGKLLLSDPVSKFLPPIGKMPVAVDPMHATEGQIQTEAVKRPVTIQDLMRHTSGITYGGRGTTAVHKIYPASSSAASKMSGAEFIDKLSTLPLLYQPGTVWDYSLSIDVLGLVVEAASKQTLGQFLQARLWGPLGMKDTGFLVPTEKASRYAKALPINPETGRPQSVMDLTKPLGFECGGGCAHSTAGDYIRFAQALLNGGSLDGQRILGRKTVAYMASDHLGTDIKNNVAQLDASRRGYGFGLTVAVRKEDGIAGVMGSKGDFNWGGAYGTYFWVDPKEDLTAVFMSQAPGAIRIHYRSLMHALVLQALETEE